MVLKKRHLIKDSRVTVMGLVFPVYSKKREKGK